MEAISIMPIVGSGVFELCIFNQHKIPELVGYYDDVEAADTYIAEHQNADIYITPQIINPSLTQRGHNMMVRVNERTTNEAVLGYRYLLLDLDPLQRQGDRIVKRPPGVSSTSEEHDAAIALSKHIIAEIGLVEENYILVDSGNGAHIYIPIEQGIQEPAIKAAIVGIKTLYETELVEVDTSVSNPARLMRAPGSMNCRGAIKRPCTYLHCPEHLISMSYEFVAGLKVEAVQETRQKGGEDLAEKAATQLGYAIKKPGPKYLLNECPFCHSTDKAAIVGRVGEDGGYYFKCHHNRCINKKWTDLKEHVGLATSRLERTRKVLKEQGSSALELPEVQADLTNLNASGELHKLRDTCADAGIEYKALKAAARKPFAIAQDMADGWIREYHIKADSLTKVLYYYQDGVYINGEDFISGLIDNKFRGINTSTFISNVLGYIRRKSIYEFDDEWLVVDNGVINPRTLEIVGFNPKIVSRVKLNVEYIPGASCPKWIKFIEECESNPTLLQETAGYPLLPGYPYQKAIMLLGGGGQGKSVFLKALSEILGRANISAASLQTLIDLRFGTAELYGRLANIAGDIPDMALSSAENFKRATGDDLVWAERKNRDPFNFWNRAKLIFSANQLPPTNDKTIGFMRRWVIIIFSREMVRNPNPHLAADLLEERSGIFNWMLEGARRVNAQGFSYTTNPEEMARLYIEKSEPVVKFIEECCEEDFDNFEGTTRVLNAYNAWAAANRMKRMSSRQFIKAVTNQSVYSVMYGRSGVGDRAVGFTGIRVLKDADTIKGERKRSIITSISMYGDDKIAIES